MNRLWLGDCLDLLREIPAGSVDLAACDPPYGTTRNAWDAVIPLDAMWKELRRIMKPNGAIVLTASQPFASALVMSNPAWFRHEWIWQKNKATGHLNAKRAPMKAHESVLVFSSKAPAYYPQMTTGHAPVNAFYTRDNGSNYGAGNHTAGGGATTRYPRSVQDFAVVNNDDPAKVHPTQKPVAIMEYLVQTYSLPGDTVLDFAMGSGTTGVACMTTGRKFIGMEKDAAYFQAASERIRAAASPAANDEVQQAIDFA